VCARSAAGPPMPRSSRNSKPQREFAQVIYTEQRAAAARTERRIMEDGAKRLCALINDPATPENVLVSCLRISQQVLTRAEAQEWREFVYFDKIAREEAKEAAERKRIEDDQKASQELFESLQRQSRSKSAAPAPVVVSRPSAPPMQSAPAATAAPATPEKRRVTVDSIAAADALIAEMAALKQAHENRPKAAKTGQAPGEPATTGAPSPAKATV
jgi:hypothetical protein